MMHQDDQPRSPSMVDLELYPLVFYHPLSQSVRSPEAVTLALEDIITGIDGEQG